MRKVLYILFFINCSLLTINCYSQPTQQWVQRFSGNGFASGLSVKLDSAGNVYVLMKLYTDSTLNDFGLLKYGTGGNLIWSRYYNSPGNLNDQPEAFAVTNAGEVYIIGLTSSNIEQQSTIVKFNFNGGLEWAKTFNAGFADIVLNKNGNVIIVGGDITKGLVVKYNYIGDTLWVKKFNNLPDYSGYAKVVLDDSDNVYTAGSYGYLNNNPDYLVVKYNTNGNLQWYDLAPKK